MEYMDERFCLQLPAVFTWPSLLEDAEYMRTSGSSTKIVKTITRTAESGSFDADVPSLALSIFVWSGNRA
jgi:hypothetical protein